MRVLVTGSSGHVGGAVIQQLCAEGHELVGLSRQARESLPPSVRQLRLDISDPQVTVRLQEELGCCDALVHCAASQENDAEQLAKVNCGGTRHMLDAAKSLGVTRFIYISSMSFLEHPLQRPITEIHPLDGTRGHYGATKYLGEWMALSSHHQLNVMSFRLSSPVGPGLQYRRIFRIFLEKALKGEEIILHGQGGRRQDYVDVRDIARAVSVALKEEKKGPANVFYIASGVAVYNLELAESCVRVLQSASAIRFSGEPDPDEEVVWEISIRKAGALLGYSPQFSLDDSIRDLAAELREG